MSMQVRVFISSTFRDMQAERDHLVRFVFPRLRQELLQRRIHLVDVDLRWGVTSEQDALSVCREVVDECRPRFLCMLGGRYGLVPPGKTRSITADEVHYGALDRDLTSRGFAYFYFRDPAATAAMVEVAPGEFREPAGSHGAVALAELKTAITEAGLQPFIYRAQWDDQSRRLIGLKEFGARVYADLQQSIDQEFGPTTGEKPDEFTEENAAMEAFIEERVQRFVLGSREPVWNELRQHAESTGGNGHLCLTGAAGSGKSALLGKFCQEFRAAHPEELVIPHFVGASPGSTDVRRTLRRLCHELVTGAGLTAEIPEDPEKLRVAFAEILQQASAHKSVVILLDAINQFDFSTQLAGWSWLPEELPANARIIVSTLSEVRGQKSVVSDQQTVQSPKSNVQSPLDALCHRRIPPREIALESLTAEDAGAIIREFLHRYRKSMTDDQRAALLAKADAGTPLYLLVALEELRTLGTYEEITARIAQLPPDTRALFIWILERLEDDDGFRDASGRKIGRELVSRFVALLGASRHGLSQQELVELLLPGDPQGNVAALAQLLRPYLMQRGELLDFYHGQFREAVGQKYLQTETQRHDAHGDLAVYFNHAERTGHPWRAAPRRSLTEFPYHLWQSGSVELLYNLARNGDFFSAQSQGVLDDPDLPFLTLKYALNAACVARNYPIAGEFTVEHARRMDARRAETPLDALLRPGMAPEFALSRSWALADSLPLTWRAYWLIVVTWQLTRLRRIGEAQATIKRLSADPGDALYGLSPLVAMLQFLTGAMGGPDFPEWFWFPDRVRREKGGRRPDIDRWQSGLVAGVIVPCVNKDEIDIWNAARRTVSVVHNLVRRSDGRGWPPVISACRELDSLKARAATMIAVGFLQAMYGEPHVDTYKAVEKLTESMNAESKEVVVSALFRFRTMIEQRSGKLNDLSDLLGMMISDATDLILAHCIVASGMALFEGQLCLPLVDTASQVVNKLQNLSEQALALSALANACARVHCGADAYFARSNETASRIDNAGIRAQTLLALAAIRALSDVDPHETFAAAHDSAAAARDESLLTQLACAKALVDYFVGHDGAPSLAAARTSAQRLAKIEDRADVLSVVFVAELLTGVNPRDTLAAAPERPARVEDQPLFVSGLCCIAEAQSIAGQDPSMTLTVAHDAVNRLNDTNERVAVLAQLACVERKLGRDPASLVGAGRRFVDQMPDSTEKVHLLIGFADAEADPSTTLASARRIIESLVTLTPEVFQASEGNEDDAETTRAQARIRWYQLDVAGAIDYLRAIAIIEARRGVDPSPTVSSMRRLLDELRGSLYVAAAADIVRTERRIGMPHSDTMRRAMEEVATIKGPLDRAKALFKVGYALVECAENAIDVIIEADAAARAVSNDLERLDQCSRIALLQIEAGLDACAMLDFVLDGAGRIPPERKGQHFASALAMIAGAQHRMGQSSKQAITMAFEGIRCIDRHETRVKALLECVDHLIDYDLVEAAVAATTEFGDSRQAVNVHLARRLLKHPDRELVRTVLPGFLTAAAGWMVNAHSASVVIAYANPACATQMAQLLGVPCNARFTKTSPERLQ